MLDFLTFRSFISLPTLIIFYYLGALILPIMTWFLCFQCIKKISFIHIVLHKGQQLIWQTLDAKQQGMMVLLFILMIGMAELFWRMIFEFLIAYMQIHDALVITLGES